MKRKKHSITALIFCHEWDHPSRLPYLALEAERQMEAAGATNITDIQYRIRRDVMVEGLVQPFGVEFFAQAERK